MHRESYETACRMIVALVLMIGAVGFLFIATGHSQAVRAHQEVVEK